MIKMEVYKTINCLSCCWCNKGVNQMSRQFSQYSDILTVEIAYLCISLNSIKTLLDYNRVFEHVLLS